MRSRWAVLAVLFVVVPVIEIYLLIQVGQVIGAWWTVLLLVADGVLGSVLVRREGGRAWRALTEALQAGRMPHRELADGALVLVGGTLLLAPGFLTDVAGLFCVLPFTRPVARRALAALALRRLGGGLLPRSSGPAGRSGPRGWAGPPRTGTTRTGPTRPAGDVIPGEVVDDDR